jgi:hypothetical protein
MDAVIFETVLNEMLEDQKHLVNSVKALTTTITDLRDKQADLQTRVEGFDQRLSDQTITAPPADTQPIQQLLQESMTSFRGEIKQGIDRVGALVEAQPKAIVRQTRILLFPESDRNGHFKYLIGKIFLALILIVLLGVLLNLGSQYIDRTHPPSVPAAPARTNGFHMVPSPEISGDQHRPTRTFASWGKSFIN